MVSHGMPSHQGSGAIIVGANVRVNLPTIIDKTGKALRMINATTPCIQHGWHCSNTLTLEY